MKTPKKKYPPPPPPPRKNPKHFPLFWMCESVISIVLWGFGVVATLKKKKKRKTLLVPIDVQSINLLVVLLICFRFYVGRKAMFDSDFKSGLYFVFSFFLLVFRVRDTRMTQLMRVLHAVLKKIHLACDLLWKVSCSNPSSQRTQLKMSEIGVKNILFLK